MGNTFKILTIDGGGIKGLYSAQVLSKFEEHFKCQLSDKFDLICGTSTGAILALAIALKIPMNDAVRFYEQKGPKIFNERIKRYPLANLWLAIKQTIVSAKYSSKELEEALFQVFEDKTLKDCNNMVCIPALNINDSSCCIFKKDYGTNSRDNNKRCVDVALASAAAPTYFPVKEIDDQQYSDGGLYANNPTLVGLLEFVYKVLPQFPEYNFNRVEILSISSFEMAHGQKHGRINKSFWNWKSTLFDAYSQGQAKFEAFLLSKIIPQLKFEVVHYRVKNDHPSTEISNLIDMDSASAASLIELKSKGKTVAENEYVKPELIKFFSTNKTISI